MFIAPIFQIECSNIIINLKNTKQNQNSIPIKLFKSNLTSFLPVLCDMINMSFITGIFPDSLKNALITPIHKRKDKRRCLQTFDRSLFYRS